MFSFMVLGYDEKRPVRDNYKDFVDKLEKGFKDLGNQGVSLMLFGSYIRGDYIPGKSDIDAILIFPDDYIINKDALSVASKVLAYAQKGNNIPFQVTVSDLRTMQESTFNSFGPDFLPYFKEEGKVIIGPDYLPTFNYTMPKHPDQIPIRFNLRKSRQGLLFAEHNKNIDYNRFLENFNKTLDATSRFSKQILHMIDGNIRKNRFSALKELPRFFPELDMSILIKIKELYYNLDDLDYLYKNPEDLMKVWNDSVTFFESLIKAYLNR